MINHLTSQIRDAYGADNEDYLEYAKEVVSNVLGDDKPEYEGDVPKWEDRATVFEE